MKERGVRWALVAAGVAVSAIVVALFVRASFATTAEATNPNVDCPDGTTLMAKFNWTGNHYVFEKPAGNENVVSISGDQTGGTWTSTAPISQVILKGGTGTDTTDYHPAAYAGTFTKQSLPKNNGGQRPDISNIQFCGSTAASAGLRVVKSVVWNGAVPNPSTTFSVCITGPSFPTTPDCKTVDFDGGTVTWSNLVAGVYTVSEASPDPAWAVTLPSPVTVKRCEVASATVTNTYKLGSLRVVKSVDWSVIPPDTSETFRLCVSGPSYPTASCKTTPYEGGTLTWTNLVPGSYSVAESDPHQNTWTVTVDTSPVTVPTGGGEATVLVHNQRVLPRPKVMFTVESQPVCLPDTQVITAEAMAHLPGTMAAKMVGTWQVILPEDIAGTLHTVDLGTVHDTDTKSWTADWPGIRYGDAEVRVRFTVTLYGDDGVTAISDSEQMDYYWTPDVCPGPKSGNLRVVKVDLGDASASGVWTFAAAGPTAPDNISITNTGDATFSSLAPGTYSVTELTGHNAVCVPGVSDAGDFETRFGMSGDALLSEAGTAMTDITVVSGETTTVYFFNRNCGAVLGSPTLYIQKYEDLLGHRTGATGLAGFQFVVKRNGVPLGDPFVSPADGLIIVPGLDGAMYTVEEIVPDGYRLTGSRVDIDNDGVYDNEYLGQPPLLELEHAGDGVRVAFYNQPRVNVRVVKHEVDGGVTSAGSGWTFTLSGCGIDEQTGTTGSDGTWTFTDLPPAAGCAYTVTETTRPGWTASPAAAQSVAPVAAGSTGEVAFTNSHDVVPTPTPSPSPSPSPTPTVLPTWTPPPPTATPTGTALTTPTPPTTVAPTQPTSTATPTPISGVAGEATPKPPVTGQPGTDGGSNGLAIGIGGMLLLGASLFATSFAIRRRGR